ncbi:RNA polymerase sigma factor [Jidongwangia harbinensis]|uniref:RNA polymerase sigma factor n=1 Tax=Jidongwangia harbinensis TaxID=2878561 RepID=UPI001CDA495E|nr:sigma-70 family RNA polymerase sigma factor [Jidongwangia harbinensis]MCA2211381.1 sigma-70 family RNA polymerase sigma factor [Jidongwangia harbinensis]
MAAAEDGDEAAWQDIVGRYTPLVASVAQGFRLGRPDVDDVAQTVWLRLVEHLGELKEPRALPRWIITTTRNECIRLFKASKRTRSFDPIAERSACDDAAAGVQPLLIGAHPEDPDEHLIRAARHQALLAALAELPPHQRDLILLLMEDPPLTYQTISERLDIPIGSIGPTRARALQRLRECPEIAEWGNPAAETSTKGGQGYDHTGLGR